ncbi:acyltransferase family protein [Nocardioides jiangxiensis]|uniref:Acyltransferase n=1 Tax=Nocardioides jiangxiensis TaxID=3064524 RepID=A0ABT9AZ24_9ACTN|nr:acyltransferase [Nocardioides sp. WY-20]MDO7867837.1 acyltransferase [Nocardioides sp. WY-20]
MDGLRGLGALAIVIAHVWLNLGTAAPLGPLPSLIQRAPLFLVMFFVLSAFLLYRPFVAAGFAGQPARVGRYAANRVRRIVPAYLLVLGASGFVLGVATVAPFRVDAGMPPTLPETGWLWTHPVLTVVNGSLLQTLLPGTVMTGIGPAWTLTVELCFYLLLPALAGLAFALGTRRLGVPAPVVAWTGPVLLVATGLVAKWVHVHLVLAGMNPVEAFFADWGPTWQAVFARSVLVQADLLGIGMGCAVLFVRWRGTSRTVARLGAIAALVLGGLAVAALLPTWYDTGWGLFWAGVVLLIATRPPGRGLGRVAGFFAAPPVHWAGEISYSVYLWHLPVILLFGRLGWTAPQTTVGFLANVASVVAVTYVLAALTWRYVERPVLRGRRAR